MPENHVNIVLVHGAWADGSSWRKVILGLRSNGIIAVTAPLPLTTLADDVAALDRASQRACGRPHPKPHRTRTVDLVLSAAREVGERHAAGAPQL